MDLSKFWNTPIVMSSEKVAFLRLGPLKLWIAQAGFEWGVASEYGENALSCHFSRVPHDVLPSGLKWIKAGFDKAPETFELKPQVPDRPVVVRPAHTILVPPGQQITIYACIPIWIQVQVTGFPGSPLGTFASEVISDTWFGKVSEGLFCYSPTRWAERDLSQVQAAPHHIICPLHLVNRSRDDLVYERMCLRPQYLSLFAEGSSLWSNAVEIEYLGRDHLSRVDYHQDAPGGGKGMHRISVAQKRGETAFNRLTFGKSFRTDFVAMNKS